MSSPSQPTALLLSMPWTALSEPSLGLGILKAVLARRGIACQVRHLNCFLLEYLTARTYFYVGETFALNDFVFTWALEPEVSAEQLRTLEEHVEQLMSEGHESWAGYTDQTKLLDALLTMRNVAVPQYLQDCLRKVAACPDATLVGFTCMFDQTIASVALAKLIKERYPEKLIVLGGYALEGPVGLQILSSFPWIDAVAFGDGEDTIEPLVRASVDRSLLAQIPGVAYRAEPGGPPQLSASRPRRADLNQSPPPDYDDYLADLEELKRENRITLHFDTLPIESSRGCWWGQTKHCVFCGIDDDTMRYRAKDADLILNMLDQMSSRYGLRQFRFSDYILPHTYFKTLLPRLRESEQRYTLSCETKANLNYERFRLLQEAGFVEIQPGIESFSSSVLRKMDKGVSAIQNIHTLVLGLHFGIEVHYNFLFGFPTDEPDAYDAMLQVIPLLYHLTPPISRSNVVTVRFAPMRENPLRFGILKPIRHDRRYDLIFSNAYLQSSGFCLDDYCYYFEQPYTNSAQLQQTYTLLRMQIQHWKNAHRLREVQLSYQVDDAGITFVDSRYSEQPKQHAFGRDHAQVYRAVSEDIRSAVSLAEEFQRELGPERTNSILQDLTDARLIYQEDNQVLGLALPVSIYQDGRAAERSAKWVSPFV